MMDVDQDIDDDTHICLKCRTTITGLENYVKHRKSGCASSSISASSNINSPVIVDVTPSTTKIISPSHDENNPNLKADDFFSSLELQSSAKKTGSSSGNSNKSPSGVLTRSKATAVIQAHAPTRDVQQSVKTDSELMSSFSSDQFVTSASSCLMKQDTRDHLMMKDDERSDQEDSACEEESNDEYDDEDEDEDDDGYPPRSHTGGKWKPGGLMMRGSPPSWTRASSSSVHGDDYRSASTGDWSLLLDDCPSSAAVTTEQAAPPPHFTGGKWKPSLTHQPVMNTSQLYRSHSEDEDEVLHENLGDRSDSNSRRMSNTSISRGPPPGHTRGKWVPGKHVRLGEGVGSGNSGSSGVDSLMHVPPLRKLGSTVQYWCGSCNRRLSSRTLYERHLLSELHFKRTLKERELEEDLGQNDAINRGTDKRTVKRTEVYLNSDIWQRSKRRRLLSGVNMTSSKQKKKYLQRREEVCCEVCKSKVWRHLLGKHLVSHYHCRKARSGHPQHTSLVLDNIHSVVKQAPFQCSPCKFYCNTMSTFKHHWLSQEHEETGSKLSGRYWCSFCKYECETSVEMEHHLESTIHCELVAVINRSVPIVIRKISVLSCGSCGQEFRYNVELRHHGIRYGHQELNTGSDEYQERFPCSECHFIGTSCSSFQRHSFLAHKADGTAKKGAYFCSACSLNFDTAEESAQHRRSQEHKYNSLASRKKRGLTEDDLTKSCPHCGGNFENILLLKTHLREQHAEFPYRCAHCGMAFTLPQEVSRHVRERACIFPIVENKPETSSPVENEVLERDSVATSLPDDIEHEEEAKTSKEMLGCNMCPYRTDSRAELLFHEVLHGNPLPGSSVDEDVDSQIQVARYRCPICSREFRKASLRCHLRIHTEERPFVCSICFRGFGHRSSMVTHIRQSHRQDVGYICELCSFRTTNKATMERHRLTHTDRNKPFLCAVCGASFFLKNTLQQHMKVHTGKDFKCPFDGCIFACRSQAELRNHQQVHSDNRPYKCDTCNYSAKTKPQLLRHQTVHQMTKAHRCPHCPFAARMASHLRRHLRLHTGAKPYRCPYCSYTCNILENLRKHVLSTSKHPGKMLYECRFCEPEDTFKSNLAKDFRVHLVTTHRDHFGSAMLAASYVAGIYDANDDPKFIEKPIQIQPKWRRLKTATVISDHDCLAKPRRDEQQENEQITGSKVLSVQSHEEAFDRETSIKSEASSSSVSMASMAPNQKFHHEQSEDEQQQLLSMVVVTDTTDDVIYIQLPPDSEGEGMERYTDSVLFPNEADSFLSIEHLDKRRSSEERNTNIGSDATIMFPLGVDEVEEIQETEAVAESEQMVVIEGNSMAPQTQEGQLDEEMTVITIPSRSSTAMGDFMRFSQEMPQQHLSEATNSQSIERFEFQVSSESNENYENVDSQALQVHSTEDQEQSYVVILK